MICLQTIWRCHFQDSQVLFTQVSYQLEYRGSFQGSLHAGYRGPATHGSVERDRLGKLENSRLKRYVCSKFRAVRLYLTQHSTSLLSLSGDGQRPPPLVSGFLRTVVNCLTLAWIPGIALRLHKVSICIAVSTYPTYSFSGFLGLPERRISSIRPLRFYRPGSCHISGSWLQLLRLKTPFLGQTQVTVSTFS